MSTLPTPRHHEIETFHQPRGMRSALRLKAQWGSEAAAVVGGTDLMVKVRAGRAAPRIVIDLGRTGLNYIRRNREWIRMGATATAGDFLRLPWSKREAPALWNACLQLGGPQIQNGATFAGNLANASPAADTPPCLLVYNAEVGIEHLDRGIRWVPVSEFLLGPGKTALAADELIREIRIPRASLIPSRRAVTAKGGVRIVQEFYKMGPRRAQVISVCCVAGWAALEGKSGDSLCVRDLRIAAGGVAPTPVRLSAVEETIRHRGLTPDSIAAAADCVSGAIAPISDIRGSAEYKGLLARNFVITFLESLLDPEVAR